MDLLLDRNNVIIFIGDKIEFGKLDTSEPNVDKWKLSENLFALDNDYKLIKDVVVPDYVKTEKYCYTVGKGFYENSDYIEPLPTTEERVTLLETENAKLKADLDFIAMSGDIAL